MIEPRSQQEVPPLLQLNISLNGGNSLTCQQCGPSSVDDGQAGAGYHSLSPNFLSGSHAAANPTMHLAREALREAAPMGLQTVRLLNSGAARSGAPSALLDALLDELAGSPFSVVLETSGGEVTPSLAARMARFSACLGLDGADAATHESIRGGFADHAPGSFDAAACAAQMLAEQGAAVEIVFAVQRGNAGQIPQMVRLAERLGASALRFVFDCPIAGGTNGGARQRGAALAVEELIAIGRRVERELARGTRLRLLFDQPPAFRGLYPWARSDEGTRCGILNTLSILPGVGGGVYALCGTGAGQARSTPALALGRLGHDPLERLWREHPTLRMLREGLPGRLSGVCERCTVKNACMGYCPTENYLRAGSFWSPYWFCEAADGVQLFPASRLIEA